MSDVEVTVRVVNPPACKRPPISATESWKCLDVFARVDRKEDGQPVVVVGCVRNGQWVPLTFFDRRAHNWWDRLSYVPPRWLPQVEEKPPRLKNKEIAASMVAYDSRLANEVPKRWKKPASCSEAAVSDKRLSLKSCAASGDRLSRLPPRRQLLRTHVYQQYNELYGQLKACEKAVKRMQLDRSLQKLDEEADRLKEGLDAPADEEQQKILSLLNCLLDLDADEFLSNVFLGREEAFFTSSGLDSSEPDGAQSESSTDDSDGLGDTEEFETKVDFIDGEESLEETSSVDLLEPGKVVYIS
jgi:hypothetical protein